jgi:WhiB family transcriptional regulator, redox-sensing transcriptional regulator
VNDWRHRARCRNVSPELFFPDATDNKQIAKAKAVCKLCPVQLQCREWALRTNEAGIWGGMTDEERRAVRRRRNGRVPA